MSPNRPENGSPSADGPPQPAAGAGLTSVAWATPDQWLSDNTSGWISADAAHWAIEPHVPGDEATVAGWLAARTESAPEEAWDWFHRRINGELDAWCGREHRVTRRDYRNWDPDRLHRETGERTTEKRRTAAEKGAPVPDESRVPDEPHLPDDLPVPGQTEGSRTEQSGFQADESDDGAADGSAKGDHVGQSALGPTLSGVRDRHRPSDCDSVFKNLESLAAAAGYKRLSQSEIQQCVGVASSWGVPLSIDFELFDRLEVYARGDVIGHRLRRQWRRLYRRQVIEVPVYQRMVVAFQLRSSQSIGRDTPDTLAPDDVHLRLFKNIPKQDIDMLLPGGKVRLSGVDRVKIILPSLGGFLLSLRKIAQFTLLLAALALHWVAILIALVIGYAVKSVMSYFRTRNRYELNLTRNLYFQKLDTNAGVLATMVDDAVTQRRSEAMLAFHALANADEESMSTRKLKRRCERYVREACNVEMDFQVARAITLLVDCGLAESDNGRWRLAR